MPPANYPGQVGLLMLMQAMLLTNTVTLSAVSGLVRRSLAHGAPRAAVCRKGAVRAVVGAHG